MAPPQSVSAAQARLVWVVVLHTGVVPPHCALDVQGTQVAVGVKQTGVVPVHFVTLVAEHCAQAPLPWQAGVALGHSASEPQARQVWVDVLHTGVDAAAIRVRRAGHACRARRVTGRRRA